MKFKKGKKGKKNAKNMQNNHWETLFSSKNLLGKETKEEEKKHKKGGRLLGEGRILGTKRYRPTDIKSLFEIK